MCACETVILCFSYEMGLISCRLSNYMDYKQIGFSKFGIAYFPGFIAVEVLPLKKILLQHEKNFHFGLWLCTCTQHSHFADTIAGYGCLCNLEKGISFPQ